MAAHSAGAAQCHCASDMTSCKSVALVHALQPVACFLCITFLEVPKQAQRQPSSYASVQHYYKVQKWKDYGRFTSSQWKKYLSPIIIAHPGALGEIYSSLQ